MSTLFGRTWCLYRLDGYSVSTNKHQAYAIRAASAAGKRCVGVFFLGVDPDAREKNILAFGIKIKELKGKLKRARSHASRYINGIADLRRDRRDYLRICRVYGAQ
jgi:hypothetical protein